MPHVVTLFSQVFKMTCKVRYVVMLIYERTSRVIGLNVIYLLMFNRHDTTHVCARERGREKERERECAHNSERGVP